MGRQVCVFQDWLFALTMQQQSVLVLACRGPDGIPKFHPTKLIVARYRATVLKAAYLGRAMRVDEGDDTTFMTLINLSDDDSWMTICRDFFEHVDQLPHHYYMHLMHGAQIAGYKHPMETFRHRWGLFYQKCCHDLHVTPETETEMDGRLSDWNRQHWDLPPFPEIESRSPSLDTPVPSRRGTELSSVPESKPCLSTVAATASLQPFCAAVWMW